MSIFHAKWCPDCEEYVPVDLFYKNKAAPDGLQGYCKSHFLARQKKRRERLKVVKIKVAKRETEAPKFFLPPERLCMTCAHKDSFASVVGTPCYSCAKFRDKNRDTRHTLYAPRWEAQKK